MQLNASTRELLGKRTRRLHRQGKLAAVVYGHNTKPTALVLDRLEFQKVFLKSGRTHLVDLLVDSGRTEKVLVREIQTHPRRLGPIHVDFYAVSLEEKITVEVPIHLTGESAAVKRGDADILQPIHALRVECLPTDIPEAFEVDLTPLEEIESEVRVSDISVPKGVTVLIDADELVVKIVHKRELKVEEEIPAPKPVVPPKAKAVARGRAPPRAKLPPQRKQPRKRSDAAAAGGRPLVFARPHHAVVRPGRRPRLHLVRGRREAASSPSGPTLERPPYPTRDGRDRRPGSDVRADRLGRGGRDLLRGSERECGALRHRPGHLHRQFWRAGRAQGLRVRLLRPARAPHQGRRSHHARRRRCGHGDGREAEGDPVED